VNNNLVKIILSILLFLCLLDLPYGYYQFARFAAMIGFAFLAYSANDQTNNNKVFVYIALAVLFQPFVKLALGRIIWIVIDIIVGVGLLISILKSINKINIRCKK